MKWTRRAAQAIQCGELTISRTVHGGAELYTLWRGNAVVSHHDTARQARTEAKRHSEVANEL